MELVILGLIFNNLQAAKQIELFESFKEARFSGQLAISDTQDHTWYLPVLRSLLWYASEACIPSEDGEDTLLHIVLKDYLMLEEIQLALADIAKGSQEYLGNINYYLLDRSKKN